MPLFIIFLGIILLLILTLKKVSPFIALLIVAILVGLALKMPFEKVMLALQNGVGSTLGSMALVLCLGAILGKMLETSGAAQQISNTLVKIFGERYIQWAVLATGFLTGITLFYNAGFVILVPLVFSIAKTARKNLLFIAIPMAASLSVTHGFLPPHPGPVGLASIFKADIGKTMLFGLTLALPIVAIAGPIFGSQFKRLEITLKANTNVHVSSQQSFPPVTTSFIIALLPVLLIAFPALLQLFSLPDSSFFKICKAISDPVFAMLAAAIASGYWLGVKRGKSISIVMQLFTEAVAGIAIIMMIIAAGGAFKEVLTASGAGNYITKIALQYNFSPLVAGWLVAALIRVTLGSATVAGLTAAGIVAPLVLHGQAKPELMVLSVGAGSLMFSHVNDTGFWMFKEYFQLTLRQTFFSWSLMETIVSVLGLIGVLLLNFLL